MRDLLESLDKIDEGPEENHNDRIRSLVRMALIDVKNQRYDGLYMILKQAYSLLGQAPQPDEPWEDDGEETSKGPFTALGSKPDPDFDLKKRAKKPANYWRDGR